MSFRKNDVSKEQLSMFSRINTLSSRERSYLDKSWAIPFAEIVFPAIDESAYEVLYSSNDSRPNTPVNIIIGGLILKELTGCTDEEFMQCLLFDIRYQTALHTLDRPEQPFSDRTFSRFRRRCIEHEIKTGTDLIHNTICSLSKEIAEVMGIGFKLLRMDSLMIESNIKKLSRLELLYRCVSKYVKTLSIIPDNMRHYIEADDENSFIYHKNEDTESKLQSLLKDAQELMKSDFSKGSNEYKNLERVITEQTYSDENGTLKLKDKGSYGLNSTILQNPSDPDATYRKKAGKGNIGYAANIVEAVDKEDDRNKSVITDYEYAQNITSDVQFGRNALSEIEQDTEIIVADGAYCADELHKAAAEKNIAIVNTNLTGRKPNVLDAYFTENNDKNKIMYCPQGYTPDSQERNSSDDGYILRFNAEKCSSCRFREECNVKIKSGNSVRILSDVGKHRAEQMKFRKTEEFKEFSAIRNGVETIPSLLRRKYKVDHMPVRGLHSTRMWFGFKIASINFTKLWRYRQGLVSIPQNTNTEQIMG